MTTPAATSATSRRFIGRARLLVLLVLLILLAVALAFSWATRDAMVNLAWLRAQRGAAQSLVDTRPWQTAQALRSQAVSAEEVQYAREAERLADHEVDQAFAAALRQAELQERDRVLTGNALALSQKVAQVQQRIAQDNALIAQLKAKNPAAAEGKDSHSAPANAALQVAQAQLGLDSDELTDAQRDLDRATGNLSVRVKNELAAHEASMRSYDSQQQSGGDLAVVSVRRNHTLAARLSTWFSQRSRYAAIEAALAEAQSDVQALTAEHNTLEAKSTAGSGTLSAIQDLSTEREILSIDDDRIQTDQQLAAVYTKWANQVELQHGILLHLILQSAEWIIAILLAMVLGDALVRRLLAHPRLDRRQNHTLRTVLQVGVQIVCLFLIVLVVFGPPHETGTMIGLATAALTIALQDYILAFLGWFMLIGKSGVHVGDMVEINGVAGEVIAVGLMSTTLLETTGLAEKGEPTGRQVTLLNSYAIRGTCFNFSSEGQWLWDEITVNVPAGADIFAIAKSIENAAREETAQTARLAEKEWKHRAHSTGLTRLSADPIVTFKTSIPVADISTGIDIQVRYVTRASGRFEVRDRLYRHFIQLLQQNDPHPAVAGSPVPSS